MAGGAEVGGAEAEEDGDGAAVAALVLQVICAVLGTHLGERSKGLSFYNVVTTQGHGFSLKFYSFCGATDTDR